jgi:hypothetical protein
MRRNGGMNKHEKKMGRYRRPEERMKNYDSGRVNS